MANDQSDIEHAKLACAACRSKKRKCDKIFPVCTRCLNAKQQCWYYSESQSEDFPYEKGTNLKPTYVSHVIQTQPIEFKSRLACSRCSAGKRKCSRDIPSCVRCARMGNVCKYLCSPFEDPAHLASFACDEITDLEHEDDARQEEVLVSKRKQSLLTIDHDTRSYLDPFHTYPSRLSRETITRILHYSIREMWPKLFPGMKYKGKTFTHEWMKSCLNCPPLFSAWLHSGAEHIIIRERASGVQTSTPKDKYELLLMRQEAIVGLRKAVDDGSPTMITDQIVMAAFAIALHPHERDKVQPSRTKMAPLSNLQLLTRFTDIVIIDGHVRGLRHLVQARGGFEQLQMPGLREGLSSWDLVVASKTLTRPFWPLQTRLELDSAAAFLASFEHSNVETRNLHVVLYSKISQPMIWVFHSLRGYSALLEGYADGRLVVLDLGYTLQLRNLIHYHVMTISSAISVEIESVSYIYEPFRLALIIYSLLVVFPVSLTTSPYESLACLLQDELELVPDEEWASMPSLLIWILTLGGIAALDTPHRLWFVERLHFELRKLNIGSWQKFLHIMDTYLWLETPCGIEGMIVWKEARQYGHQPLVEDHIARGSVFDIPVRD